MIRGLDKFREHFAGFQQHYALIGGVASSMVLEEAGINFRQTKDFDIVLCVEALDRDFVEAFWEFVRRAGYQNQQLSSGEKIFYRFEKPADSAYPAMLELFSRNPDYLHPADGSHLTPIPVDEEVASLSAILLDADYYNFLKQHIVEIDGVSVVNETGLIPLKAKAWLDLSQRYQSGEIVDSRNIKKHKNDVLRLFQVIPPDLRVSSPDSVTRDMTDFVEAVLAENSVDLKQLGLVGITLSELLERLTNVYQLPAIKRAIHD